MELEDGKLLEAAPLAWRRLYEKFGISPSGASGLVYVSSVVQPAVDMDALLRVPGAHQHDSSSFSGGFGPQLSAQGFTVPAGQRLLIQAITIYQKTGDNTLSTIELRDQSESREVTIDTFSSVTTRTFIPGQPLELDQLDGVWWTLDGAGSSTSTWRTEIWGYLSDIA